jgi:tRNA(fMet)-specific endonuclease VapC
MPALLDTNIISDLLRHPDGQVARHIARVGEEAVCTSIIVAAELRFGAAKKRSPQLTARVEGVLSRLKLIPFGAPADKTYAELRARLEAAGEPIGANDTLIAAHALSLGYALVTDNEREFSRVPGLTVVNWLR